MKTQYAFFQGKEETIDFVVAEVIESIEEDIASLAQAPGNEELIDTLERKICDIRTALCD